MQESLSLSNLTSYDIYKVVLLGASTNLRDMHTFMCKHLGEEKIHISINADYTVALGTAVYAYAASDSTENVKLTEYSLPDIIPRTLAVLVINYKIAPLIEKKEGS